ncbi:MAG: hypothetical protein JNL32_02370 [Candidatus Kapabacteria bacterium]|nr:hypothetical protein [Candidatus Kapabacteria bacterium]
MKRRYKRHEVLIMRAAKIEMRRRRVAHYAKMNRLFGRLDEEAQKVANSLASSLKKISMDADSTLKQFPLGGIIGKPIELKISDYVFKPEILRELKEAMSENKHAGCFGFQRWSHKYPNPKDAPADPNLE